jgi:hypothetical protein
MAAYVKIVGVDEFQVNRILILTLKSKKKNYLTNFFYDIESDIKRYVMSKSTKVKKLSLREPREYDEKNEIFI